MTRSVARIACVIATVFTISVTKADITSGLAAYYPFNGNANDESGNAQHLTVVGPVLCPGRTLQPDTAYYFDGLNDFMVRSNRLTSSNPFTWSVWVRSFTNANWNNNYFLHQGDPDGTSARISPTFGIDNDGKPARFDFRTWDGAARVVFSSNLVGDVSNTWYHVVVTSSTSGTRRMYVNGVIETTAVNQAFGQLCPNFYVGANRTYLLGYLHGQMDNIRVYNRELSTADVLELYAFESQPRGDIRKSIHYVAHELTVGTSYKVEESIDLTNWVDSGVSFTATNSTWLCPTPWFVDEWDQLYLRLQKQ
jgi:hypothetical protein